MRLLLVEDETELAEALKATLVQHGMVVDHVGTLADAREAMLNRCHDALLLDRQLPDGDGLSMVPALRAAGHNLPVIILTARDALPDRIDGLDTGADDYLTKPFAIGELLARLRAVRRRAPDIPADEIRVGRLVFDLSHRQPLVDGVPLALPRRELLLLEVLVRRQGRTVARSAVEEAVYSFDDEIQSNALDAHVSRLRRKLAELEAGVDIHSIRGVGFLLKGRPA